MKVQYCSNLYKLLSNTHSKLPKPVAPLLILLGDILNPFNIKSREYLAYFSNNWEKTLWIPGKKELIHNDISWEEALHTMKEICPQNIQVLSNQYYENNKLIILGTTLISTEFKKMKIYPVGHYMRKYPILEELNNIIQKEHNWLKGMLEELKEHNINKKIVVASYTAPLQFSDEPYNYTFNNYPHLWMHSKYSPKYWFIGNTEKNMSICLFNCNNDVVHFSSNSAKYPENFSPNFWEKIETHT
jgi:hypothetical protein